MGPEHRVAYDSVFGAPPFLLCASHFAPVTRKRLWWTNNEPAWPEGTEVKARGDGVLVVKPPAGERIPLQSCLMPGWWPAALRGREQGSFAFCCFTRHSKASGPRPGAAGLARCSE